MKTVAKSILKTWLSPPYYSQSAVDVCSKISLARNTSSDMFSASCVGGRAAAADVALVALVARCIGAEAVLNG